MIRPRGITAHVYGARPARRAARSQLGTGPWLRPALISATAPRSTATRLPLSGARPTLRASPAMPRRSPCASFTPPAWSRSRATSTYPTTLPRGRAALLTGAPILCDAQMVAHGITRRRLPAGNEVICTLSDPQVPALAQRLGNDAFGCCRRPLAAQAGGRRRLDRQCADRPVPFAGAPRCRGARSSRRDRRPVGFVGAAESKEALVACRRVPYLVVNGRKGGSAIAAAAVNALASERE